MKKHALGLFVCCALLGCTSGAEDPGPLLEASDEAVTFQSEGLALEGTLLLPERHAADRSPAVVLGHGSGAIDRDETVSGQLGMDFGFELETLGEVAAALRDAGYVVLKYDKRTCTAQTGCANAYPPPAPGLLVDTLVADVEAGLDWVAARPEVDSERIFYVGHSQGAQFAPRILSDRPSLRAGVMLASPERSIDIALGAQAAWLRTLLGQAGLPQDEIDAGQAEIDAAVSALAELRAGSFQGSSIMGASTTFWKSWMDLGDAAPALASASPRPLLALSGDYDWNVPATETELWAELFASTPGVGHQAVVLPCVTHVLNCIAQPDWMRITPDDFGRHVDASVLDALLGFLDAQL